MGNASYIQPSFLGGEKSQLAQGRIDEKDYRTWMNVCVNGHPTEGGAYVRRAGTMFAGTSRNGAQARCVKFDFTQAAAYTIEFTDGALRFRKGLAWATTNDAVGVASISTANPAILQTSVAVSWGTGTYVTFANLGITDPVLQNRQFALIRNDSTHFQLTDGVTGAAINGATFTTVPASTMVSRIQEVVSPYVGGSWASLRMVQAETTGVLLQGAVAPQLLSVTTLPASGVDAQFSLGALTFLDGPYLDPFINGAQVTPNAVKGAITLALAFQAFDAGKAYKIGDFVTSSAINYVSIIDNNVGNTPAGSPSAWTATSAGAAINNGLGFIGTDIGRLVRLYSEPAAWSAATTYATGNVVSYNPSGAPGASSYWVSLVGSNTGNIPGNDVTHWTIAQNAALWSWGKITSLANQIAQATGSVIGNMNGSSAAFDAIIAQSAGNAANLSAINGLTNGFAGQQFTVAVDCYVGKNFTGIPKQISTVTLYGTTDLGFFTLLNPNYPIINVLSSSYQVILRAKQTAPASPSDGTLLAASNPQPGPQNGGTITFGGPVTLTSNDQVTAWNFIWVELVASATGTVEQNFGGTMNLQLTNCTAEVQFFAPPGTGSGNAINVEILGPPLLYTTSIITWRLGAYSNTTGWPTCGTYHEGRIWLGGAVDNRFDASVSNGLSGTTLNFAPTDQNGVVGAANAIAGTVNSDGVNPIFWLTPDLQGIIMGTQAGEWLISAPSPGSISAVNISARRVTRIGCANVEPRKTDHTNIFVQRYTRKVMEYFTDVYSGKFAAPNLAKDALHITKPGVAEIAYTQAVVPIIWGRNADGSWFGITYKRDTLATSQGPTINGWHRHTLGSGRSVTSICAGPSVGGNLDALTMVTFNSTTGVYHVEVMTDTVDEGNTLLQASYLDDAVNPTSTTTTNTPSQGAPYGALTLNGLWHLNGSVVQAWLGGLDCGNYTVTNGSITVPYGDSVSAGTAAGLFTAPFAAGLTLSQMLIGFTFTSQGQIVRPALPAESGSRNGPAVGKTRRNHKFVATLEGTGVGLSFGTTFAKVDPVSFRQPNGVSFTVNQQFTGIYKNSITDDNSLDGMLCWQVTRPYPANIANIGGFIETADE